MINNNQWNQLLLSEYKKSYFIELMKFLDNEYTNSIIYPKKEDIFKAFEYTPLSSVKVLILGQDPYHDDNQANGLAFSVPFEEKIPPSLQNIFKELHNDLCIDIPKSGDLKKWATEGVLLLNTVLTVRAHEANSHKGMGWELFTDSVIRIINSIDRPIVIFLWGNNAKEKLKLLNNSKHLIISTPHPSPLSAYRGFFFSKPFSRTNDFLKLNGITPIDWTL
jgi:uracil-DNA glycosylase